jgi:UDP-N-acetylmuramoyl-tripeptide--D-alanyl-D-alanine ligase
MATFIQNILRSLAALTLHRYRPAVVAVTGSVGKTSTKLAIAAVLGSERYVRPSKGNFNSDIGVALTILGDWSKEELRLISLDTPAGKYFFRKLFFFLKIIGVALWRLVRRVEYPEVLILEYGIDRPGDMSKLLQIARPNVGVMTAIGDTPGHVEFFTGPDDVAREKGKLVEAVPATGFVVLNADDARIMHLKSKVRAQLVTFGAAKDATVMISGISNRAEGMKPIGIAFKLENAEGFVPVRLDNAFGRSNAYASAAAASVGLVFGMNLVSISAALETYYRPAPHRMELVSGVKGIWIIDDSYNAGPLSMRSALDTLDDLPAKRKVAILGDMREIGKFTKEEHAKLGKAAAKVADVLVTVGPEAHAIAENAREAGFSKKNVMEFDTVEDALTPIQTLVQHGDLVLVKASHSIGLSKIVQELRSFESAG